MSNKSLNSPLDGGGFLPRPGDLRPPPSNSKKQKTIGGGLCIKLGIGLVIASVFWVLFPFLWWPLLSSSSHFSPSFSRTKFSVTGKRGVVLPKIPDTFGPHLEETSFKLPPCIFPHNILPQISLGSYSGSNQKNCVWVKFWVQISLQKGGAI